MNKRSIKVKAIMYNYGKMLSFLIDIGALLNTIRPEYLLSYSDYNVYIRTLNNLRCE